MWVPPQKGFGNEYVSNQSVNGKVLRRLSVNLKYGGLKSPTKRGSVQSESMAEAFRPRVKYVIGPDGSPLTIADLPPTSTKRWVIRRKAEVVAAVRGGLLSLEEACSRYTLTVDEFLSWQMSIDQHGLAGLRTTRIQQYRQ